MEVIEPLGLSVTKAAEVLGVTRPALSALLNGRAAVSPEMALRVEKAFGPKMDTLLRMRTALIAQTGENLRFGDGSRIGSGIRSHLLRLFAAASPREGTS